MFAQHHLRRRVHDHPARDTELGVVSLGYEPREYEAAVRALGDRFEVREEGRITYRDVEHPVLRVLANRGGAKRLLVLGGVHGNEQAGILAVPEIVESIARAGDELARVELCVLTPVNPVGAACFSRFNGDGYDINRDFVRFDTEEARIVRRVWDAQRPDFVVALHEGPQDATFMFTNQHVPIALAERLLAALEQGGTTLATHDYFGRALRPPGLAPMSRGQWALVKLWAATLGMMATNVYAADRGVPEITLESSWRTSDRGTRTRAHVDLVMALARELARSE